MTIATMTAMTMIHDLLILIMMSGSSPVSLSEMYATEARTSCNGPGEQLGSSARTLSSEPCRAPGKLGGARHLPASSSQG